MVLIFEVYDGINWVDKTDKLVSLRRTISSRELEKLEGEILEALSIGQKIRLKKDTTIIFEGIIYEIRKDQKSGDVFRCGFTAYSDLILYDRHVVYKVYDTGTKAGTIIKDLASLESGVDVSNVDEDSTPQLNSPWTIENEKALNIMQSVAKGTNYWLRMKPGKILYFKPKTTGSYVATIDSSKIISAEYSEDRWKLKNRVIYVGANGQVLADVSEGAGDLPVVVHDPFLTDVNEAQRRANIRLALNKEYGKQLCVEMHQDDFEAMNVDLGDTIRVNLPSLGLENVDMYLVEIEYDPREMRYTLTLGGRLELFEEFFEEAVGGDVAARFGQAVKVPELISTIYTSIDATNMTMKLQADARTVRLYNNPPLILEDASNIFIDEYGYASLISGATSGSFTFSHLPKSELFTKWLRIHYIAENNEGSVTVDLLRGNNEVIDSNIPEDYDFMYLPESRGWWTEMNASDWGIENGVLEDSENGAIGFYSVKAIKSGISATMRVYYPKSRDAKWGISKFKYLTIYFYSLNDDPLLKIRLKENEQKYLEAIINHKGGAWRRYEIVISTMINVGNPNMENINWIEIETSLPSLYIDSDYVFTYVKKEQVKMKFTLSRPSADKNSPKVKLIKLVWREG